MSTQGLTDYAADKVGNALLNGASLGAPSTWYLALATTAFTNAYTSGSPTGVEASYTGYARIALTANTSNFPNASGSVTVSVTNAFVQQFGTNTGSSQTVVGWGLFDASTNGNLWIMKSFTGVAIGNGIIAQFAVGTFGLQLISQ